MINFLCGVLFCSARPPGCKGLSFFHFNERLRFGSETRALAEVVGATALDVLWKFFKFERPCPRHGIVEMSLVCELHLHLARLGIGFGIRNIQMSHHFSAVVFVVHANDMLCVLG